MAAAADDLRQATPVKAPRRAVLAASATGGRPCPRSRRGEPFRDKRAVLGVWVLVFAWVGGSSACSQTPPAEEPVQLLERVELPDGLRAGSPVRVSGRGLGHATLRLLPRAGGPALQVRLGPAVAPAQGASLAGLVQAWGQVEVPLDASQAELAGVRFERACLAIAADGDPGGDVAPCLNVDARWLPELTAGPLAWPEGSWALGERLEIQAADLLLPGEGLTWVEIARDDLAARSVALHTSLDTGRQRATVDVSSGWMGVTPGVRRLRWRLVQRVGSEVAHGPWGEGHKILAPLEIAPMEAAEPAGLQRGMVLPLRLVGAPPAGEEGAWEAAIVLGCVGSCPAGAPGPEDLAHAPWRPLEAGWWGGQPALWLSSPLWFAGGWEDLRAAGWTHTAGVVRVRLRDDLAVHEVTVPVELPVLPTEQIIVLQFGDGFALGAQRYGLGALSVALREKILARVQAHFADLRVRVAAHVPARAVEFVRVRIQDTDPNGLGLLGVDSSPGKDVGNLTLSETLADLSPAARVAGDAAWGGVFMAGFEAFSPTLRPGSAPADARFDAIFGPFMPALGGVPAGPGALAPAAEALEALAQLVAGTVSHEVGHTLGLPAVGDALHHPSDNPGWRMDAGHNRPFAERAGLPGEMAETWGPVDSAYLSAILGGSQEELP